MFYVPISISMIAQSEIKLLLLLLNIRYFIFSEILFNDVLNNYTNSPFSGAR